MTIHKEGHIFLLVSFLLLGALNTAFYYWVPAPWTWILLSISIVFYLLLLQFFRNPSRKFTQNPRQVIAPADGKVVVIEEVVETEYFRQPRRQVSIFMSPINVHINRSPLNGVVQYFKYHSGLYLVAWHPKASTDNERTTLVIKTANGVEILLRQIAGALAKRIRWYVKEGDALTQGQEFGFIKFGSRVDIFLPLDAKILVHLNDKTTGGMTPIAELAE